MPGSSAAKTPHYQLESVPVPNQPMSTQGPERRSSPATQAASQGKVPNQNPFEDEKDKDSSSVLLGRVVEKHFPPLYYRYMSNEKISPEDEINGIESNEEMQCIEFLNSMSDDDRLKWLLKKVIPKGYSLIDPSGAIFLAEADEKHAQLDPSSAWKQNGQITDRVGFPAVDVVPRLPSKMNESDLLIFYHYATLFLAPYIAEMKDDEKKKYYINQSLNTLSNLKPAQLDEIFVFVISKGISAENLDCLGLKARAAVLNIYYIDREPWNPILSEDSTPDDKAVRSKRRTPDDLMFWLNENFPDRVQLRLLQGDLRHLDPAAYQKIMTWTQPKTAPKKDGKVVPLPDFGLPTKAGLYDPEAAIKSAPTGAEVFAAYKEGNAYAPVLKRRCTRAQYHGQSLGLSLD